MTFDPKRRYSDRLERHHIENIRAAVSFAHEIGHPFTLCIDINWTRTRLGDDPDGRVLATLMELSRKWLKPNSKVATFAWIAVRECPEHCPNAHILVHCPDPLIPAFKKHVRAVLRRECRRLYRSAVDFTLVGSGNPTFKAASGKLAYMSKGANPDTAEQFDIRRVPQGRIYGKRVSISQDINRAARQRHVASEATVQGRTSHRSPEGLGERCTEARGLQGLYTQADTWSQKDCQVARVAPFRPATLPLPQDTSIG